MALTAYQTAVTNLLQAPSSPTPLVPTTQLTTYINNARLRVAVEAECVRNYASLSIVANTASYPFTAIVLSGGASSVTGIAAPLVVRTATYNVAGGARFIVPRPWPWFNYYVLNNPVPVPGPPTTVSQYGQGLAGTLFFNIPDVGYTLNLDTACTPILLVDDTTVEAIPYPWTDSVPFYAAWLAFMQLQKPADADRCLNDYKMLMSMARKEATADVLPNSYEQVSDPTLANKLASQPLRTGGDIGVGSRAGAPSATTGA